VCGEKCNVFCYIDKEMGNNDAVVRQSGKKPLTLEKICSLLCFLAGAVFLVMALFGSWRYFFLMGVCTVVGVMIYEDPKPVDTKKKRRDDR